MRTLRRCLFGPLAAFFVVLCAPALAQVDVHRSIVTAQVSVAATSTATASFRASRYAVTITVTGSSTQDVYCGPGTITTATGDIIPGVKGAARTYNTSAAINCIVASSTQTVTVSETY